MVTIFFRCKSPILSRSIVVAIGCKCEPVIKLISIGLAMRWNVDNTQITKPIIHALPINCHKQNLSRYHNIVTLAKMYLLDLIYIYFTTSVRKIYSMMNSPRSKDICYTCAK